MITVILKKLFPLMLLCLAARSVHSMAIDTVGNPYLEILRLKANMEDTGRSVRFDVDYRFKRIDSAGTSLDSMSGYIAMRSAKYGFLLGDVIMIQDRFLNIYIDRQDSTVLVSRPKKSFNAVLQTDVLQENFQSLYIDSITVRDSSTTRIMKFFFKKSSPYSYYELVYEASSYHMLSLSYRLRNSIPVPDLEMNYPPDTYFTELKIKFFNYNILYTDDSLLDTSLYIAQANGTYVGVGSYTLFQIVNQTNDYQ